MTDTVATDGDGRVSLDDLDPIRHLPPTGRRMLRAAYDIVREDGMSALTLQAVATRSGEHKASVGYYFGNKNGLLAMLSDYVFHDIMDGARNELRGLPPGEDRVREAVRVNRDVAEDYADFRVFLEILSLALRQEDLRERMSAIYEEYRRINAAMLVESHDSGQNGRLRALASLCLAVTDGLSVQSSLDPKATAASGAWEMWESIVRAELDRLGQPGARKGEE